MEGGREREKNGDIHAFPLRSQPIAILLYCQEPYGRNLGKREFYDSEEAPEALFEYMGLYDRTFKERMTPFGRVPSMHETSDRFKIRKPSVTPTIPPTIRRPSTLNYQSAVDDLKLPQNSPRKQIRRESSGGRRMKLKPIQDQPVSPNRNSGMRGSQGSMLRPADVNGLASQSGEAAYYEIDGTYDSYGRENSGSVGGGGGGYTNNNKMNYYGPPPEKGAFLTPVDGYDGPPSGAIFPTSSDIPQEGYADDFGTMEHGG